MSILAGMIPVGMALNMASKLIHSRGGHPKTSFSDVLQESLGSRLVKQWDGDGDGALSVSEFGGAPKAFARLDRDGDGALTAGELDAGLAQAQFQRRASALSNSVMRLYDSDGDGALTAAELPLDEEVFAAIDVDGDGRIDRDELLRAYMHQNASLTGTEGI